MTSTRRTVLTVQSPRLSAAKLLHLALGLASGLPLLACSSDSDRYEDVSKLRAIGVQASPVVATPSTTGTPSVVTLTFYAAAPLGTTVTASSATDNEGAANGYTIPLVVTSGSDAYKDYQKLRVYSVTATFTVPTVDTLQFSAQEGFATVHYALDLHSSTAGDQLVTGNAVVFPSGATELQSLAKLPGVAITSPADGTKVGNSKQPIGANLTPTNDETYRFGWFVSGGEIQNRNATATNWDPKGTGAYTVIATARGAKSGAFTFVVADVTSI